MSRADFTAQQAARGQTPAEVLAQIAAERPDLRPYLALNPAAYSDLLEWLAGLGDPAVNAALAHRAASTRAGVPPPPPPPQSVQTQAAPQVAHRVGAQSFETSSGLAGAQPWEAQAQMPRGAAQAGRPSAVALRTKPARSGRVAGLIVGAVTMAVIAALVARFFFWSGSGTGTHLDPYPVKPSEAWTFEISQLSVVDSPVQPNPNGWHFGSVVEAGPVLVATVGHSGGFVVAGLIPGTGEVRWETPFETASSCRGSGPGVKATVLCVTAGNVSAEQGLTALDPDTGEVLSYATLSLGMLLFNVLDEDAIIYGFDERFGRKIARFASDGTEQWSVDVTPGAGSWNVGSGGPRMYLLEDSIVIDSPLFQGREKRADLWVLDFDGNVLWQGPGEFKGVDPAGRILVQTLDVDLTPTGAMVLSQQGEMLWEAGGYRIPEPLSSDNTVGPITAFNRANELVELDVSNGNETRLLLEARDEESVGSARVMAVGKTLVADIGGELVGVDLGSGDEMWSRPFEGTSAGLMADGDRLVFLDGGALVAISIRDGSQTWRHVVPDRASFVMLGNEIVLVDGVAGRLSLLQS